MIFLNGYHCHVIILFEILEVRNENNFISNIHSASQNATHHDGFIALLMFLEMFDDGHAEGCSNVACGFRMGSQYLPKGGSLIPLADWELTFSFHIRKEIISYLRI